MSEQKAVHMKSAHLLYQSHIMGNKSSNQNKNFTCKQTTEILNQNTDCSQKYCQSFHFILYKLYQMCTSQQLNSIP